MEQHAYDFTRDPGPLPLTGVRASTLDELRGRVAGLGLEGIWTVSDLSLGAWRGHQVATEFLEQLGVERPRLGPETPPQKGMDGSGFPYADIVGRFIDAEARGDRSTLEALALAGVVAGAVGSEPRLFIVLAPLDGLPWEEENILFVRFLSAALDGTPGRLIVAAGDETTALPEDWSVTWHGTSAVSEEPAPAGLSHLVPGVITPETALALASANPDGLDALHPLGSGRLLVPPEMRRHPGALPRLAFDRLADAARGIGWLEGYAHCRGNTIHTEPWLVYMEALERFAEGGSGITLRLVDRAIETAASAPERAIFQSHAQGIRLALERFAEAAAVDPPERIMPELRGFLCQATGWGLVMTGRLERAEECFSLARELMSPLGRDRREFLYLLNISALCRLKSGNVEGAMEMEKEIEERAAALPRPDRRLDYVNSINIARLYRRRGELDEAERYFERAFSTTLGARSESDAIYTNLCMARLYADLGRPAAALTCWLRTALHWTAADAPEALSRRAATAIIGRRPRRGENLPEAVSAALATSLASAAETIGIAVDGGDDGDAESSAPVVVNSGRFLRAHPGTRVDAGLLAGGVGVFTSEVAMPPQVTGRESARLRRLVAAVIGTCAPAGYPDGTRTIVVDDRSGRELPATAEELLTCALHLHARRVTVDDTTIELTPELLVEIEARLGAAIGPAVDRLGFLEGRAVILFQRYAEPTLLSIEQSGLIRLFSDAPTIGALAARTDGSRESLLEMLLDLERQRVVTLDLAPGSAEEILRAASAGTAAAGVAPSHVV